MKRIDLIALILFTLFFASQFALAEESSWYERAGWASSQKGFIINENLTLLGRDKISASAPQNQSCTLKAGTEISYSDHLASGKLASIYRQRIIRYKVLKELVLKEDRGEQTPQVVINKVAPGQTIEELSQITNELCLIRINGKTEDIPCPSKNSEKFERLPNQTSASEQWISVKCKEGSRVWFMDSDLSKNPKISIIEN